MVKLIKFSKFQNTFNKFFKKTKEGHIIVHPDDIGIRENKEVKKTKEGHIIVHPDDIGIR